MLDIAEVDRKDTEWASLVHSGPAVADIGLVGADIGPEAVGTALVVEDIVLGVADPLEEMGSAGTAVAAAGFVDLAEADLDPAPTWDYTRALQRESDSTRN